MTTPHIRALLEQALAALESLFSGKVDIDRASRCADAIQTLRAELAKPEQEESFIPNWANYRQGVADGKAGNPKWHDAPTCPGLWVLDDGTALVLESGTLPKAFDGLRWYGPIPQDTKAEGEST